MNSYKWAEEIAASIENVPERAEVIALRQFSLDEIEGRAKRFLSTSASACGMSFDRGDWVTYPDHTLVRLTSGARATIYHASGALELVAGLEPMEFLFGKVEEQSKLVKQVEKVAARLNINEWAGQKQSIQFERLWQIKAAAAEPNGKPIDPVLCRIVGAYRHYVNELPVWGAASVAVKVAGEGKLDSVQVQMREPTGEVIDRPEILRPEQAARQIALQLEGLMGKSDVTIDEIAKPQWLRFGYFSLPKRKAQRLLAPVYVASISIKGEDLQAYMFAVSATEKAYLPLCLNGSEAFQTPARRLVNNQTDESYLKAN